MRSVMPSKITGFLFCALLLFPFTAWSAGEDGKSQDERKIYTVIEFESTFMNRKKEKVLEVLGEPDRKWARAPPGAAPNRGHTHRVWRLDTSRRRLDTSRRRPQNTKNHQNKEPEVFLKKNYLLIYQIYHFCV